MSGDYRLGVGIFLLNKEKKLWVGKRIDFKTDFWQMPQGGIDENESPRQAMIRELGEEVGLKKNFQIANESKQWLSYMLPSELKEKIWKGRYIGQKQKWFIMKFTGEDSEINIKTKKPEFLEWKWIDLESLTKVVVDFKLHVYQEIQKQLELLLVNRS